MHPMNTFGFITCLYSVLFEKREYDGNGYYRYTSILVFIRSQREYQNSLVTLVLSCSLSSFACKIELYFSKEITFLSFFKE